MEKDEWICSCGNHCRSIYTIDEWCDEYDLDEYSKHKLYDKANELNYDSDICFCCFEKLCKLTDVAI